METKLSIARCALFCAAALSAVAANADNYDPADTNRVSAGTYSGAPETNGLSENARMSKNGRFIVFESVASNIVSDASSPPNRRHCYIYDRQADQIERVSLTSGGAQIDADCFSPSVSNDGRYVAFASAATVSSTVSVCADDFCHVNQAYAGTHIWVRDRFANDTMLISQVSLPVKRQAIDAATLQPSVQQDDASGHLVPVLETVTKRVAAAVGSSHTPATCRNPRISSDGQYVVYDTDADNLVLASTIEPTYAALVPDGGVQHDYDPTTGIIHNYQDVFFPPDNYYVDDNGVRDIYVRDGSAFTNALVSLGCKFHDPNNCQVKGTSDSTNPVISDDGTIVVFSTSTKFLGLDFNGVEDIFLVERSSINGEVENLIRISNDATRIVAGNGASTRPALSADGRFVAFQSAASNLVTGDTNGKTDVFVFDRTFNRMVLCSKPATGGADQNSTLPDITGAGEYVVFQSTSTSFGVSSAAAQVYIGTITKGPDGDARSCSVEIASKGSGAGAAVDATISTVGVVPRSSTVNGTLVRTRAASVTYQTAATNISDDSDSNGFTDVFQTPICSDDERNTDTDGDGTSDCFDQCATDPISVESDDTDADGVADCEDGCSGDPQKTGAGLCGCGISDTDTDSDGTADCSDECDNDPAKTDPGACGCGISDADANNNGTPDCNDIANPNPTGTATPSPTSTPTFNLTTFTPAAPAVKRSSGSLRVSVRFSNAGVTDETKVLDYDLTGRRIVSAGGKERRSTTFRRRHMLDGIIKLPSAGKWIFTVRFNGLSGEQSLPSAESRAVTVTN